MRSIVILATAATVFLGGCASESSPPTADDPSTRSSTTAESQPSSVTAYKPPTDDFGLPLVIVMKAPEVPEAIRGPSPPIKEVPETKPKKKTGWLW